MIDIVSNYQANFFADMTDVKPTADTIPVFLNIFRDKGFLPNTIQELGPTASVPQTRLRLSSQDNEWNINIQSDRIAFTKSATKPKGDNVGTPQDFTTDIVDFSRRILERFPKKAYRLALITEGMLRKMSEDELQKIYSALSKSFPFYIQNPPYEWDSRTVAKLSADIASVSERLNIITIVRRVQGEIIDPSGIIPLDRILIHFDINTFQGNLSPRFDIDALTDFFNTATNTRNLLLEQLKGHINA
jgi:hypothetical protein